VKYLVSVLWNIPDPICSKGTHYAPLTSTTSDESMNSAAEGHIMCCVRGEGGEGGRFSLGHSKECTGIQGIIQGAECFPSQCAKFLSFMSHKNPQMF